MEMKLLTFAVVFGVIWLLYEERRTGQRFIARVVHNLTLPG